MGGRPVRYAAVSPSPATLFIWALFPRALFLGRCCLMRCSEPWLARAVSARCSEGGPLPLFGPDQPAMAGPVDEGQHFLDQFIPGIFLPRRGETVCEHALMAVQIAKEAVQPVDLLLAEAAPLQANDVQPGEPRSVADDAAERDHVAFNARHTADHRRPPDAHELVQRGAATDH